MDLISVSVMRYVHLNYHTFLFLKHKCYFFVSRPSGICPFSHNMSVCENISACDMRPNYLSQLISKKVNCSFTYGY